MRKKIIANQRKQRRSKRTRAKIFGTAARPRLTVFRSNRSMYVQLIDDVKGATLASASPKEIKKEDYGKGKSGLARHLGILIAKKAKEQNIEKAVFDRRSYRYHGRVKSVAEGAREAGMQL